MTDHRIPGKKFVAVAGNIGVGKSALTERLARELGWEPFFEAVDDNPFLGRRLRHHVMLLRRPNSVIQDRTIYEDAEIFARNLYERGDLSERDWRVYRELYETLLMFLPPPDLVIYLRASVPTLQRRIVMRGRPFEQAISPDYLGRLNDLYEAWIERFDLCPVLTVPADHLDFVRHRRHLQLILDKVIERLQGKEEVAFEDAILEIQQDP